MASDIIIPDNIYNRILTCVGYPVISEDDLGVSQENILDLFIGPALKNVYYKWFPILGREEYDIDTSFSIDFPDDETFGVVDSRLVWRGSSTTFGQSNVFFDLNKVDMQSSFGRNKWNTGNDYGYTQVYYSKRAFEKARINDRKSLKQWIDYNNRKIEGYTNTGARLAVTWAKWSNNWSGVQFKFEEDAIKLCQSYILQYFGNLLNQGTGDLPTELNGDSMIDRAETLYDEVITKFKEYSKVVIMRG